MFYWYMFKAHAALSVHCTVLESIRRYNGLSVFLVDKTFQTIIIQTENVTNHVSHIFITVRKISGKSSLEMGGLIHGFTGFGGNFGPVMFAVERRGACHGQSC